MCDPEDPKSPDLAGLDEDVLVPSSWNNFSFGSPRSQSLRSFPAPWLSRLAFLMRMVFFALSFTFSIIILFHVLQTRRQYNLDHEADQKKLNQLSTQLKDEVLQNQSQYNLDHEVIQKKLNQLTAQLKDDRVLQNQSQNNLEAILKKLNQLSAQLKDDRDLKAKEQFEVSRVIIQLNKTLSMLCRPCPCNWKFYEGSCYYFSVDRKAWEAARETCEADDSNLAIISSSVEQSYLKQKASSNQRWWVGLSDKKKEGTWHWVDGTTLKQAFWNEGEPNNYDDEDCCELTPQGWNDAPCSMENYWICEKEAFLCSNF